MELIHYSRSIESEQEHAIRPVALLAHRTRNQLSIPPHLSPTHMVCASAGIEYYLFYIHIRRWRREAKMPSFRKSFAHAKHVACLTLLSFQFLAMAHFLLHVEMKSSL